MFNVILRQEAIDDLNDIWEYTFEQCSELQADKYYATLKFSCKEIGENPELGREYSGIGRNLLGLKSGKHIIFYQPHPTRGIKNSLDSWLFKDCSPLQHLCNLIKIARNRHLFIPPSVIIKFVVEPKIKKSYTF